jgi:hypothetical protein
MNSHAFGPSMIPSIISASDVPLKAPTQRRCPSTRNSTVIAAFLGTAQPSLCKWMKAMSVTGSYFTKKP